MALSTAAASASGLVLSQRLLSEYAYVNFGRELSLRLSGQEVSEAALPMLAWDTAKTIIRDFTLDGTVAIDNIAILFEPALKINVRAFILDSVIGRKMVIKLNHPIAQDGIYYPFPEDKTYKLDLSGISYTTIE